MIAARHDPHAGLGRKADYEDVRPLARPIPMPGKLGFFHVSRPARSPAPPARASKSAPAARPSEAARKANATRKARKLADTLATKGKKAGTDWSEAGRKAYRTRLQSAAARGDKAAAAKLAKLSG